MKKYGQLNGKFNVSGFKIKYFRKGMNMSQENLAVLLKLFGLDMNQKIISRIESGKRIVTDYELICFVKVFGITVEDLLTKEINT